MKLERLTCSTAWRSLAFAAAGLAMAAPCVGAPGKAAGQPSALAAFAPRHTDFRGEAAPLDVRQIADWALDTRDHENLPFVVIDKKGARVYVFAASGRLLGAAPILLGRAVGDEFEAGVIDMEMNETHPWQRITPAGRFRAEEFRKAPGKWILWVDYDSAIALHKLLLIDPAEQRQARIEARDPYQRRITYGCINVPIEFYDRVIHPVFNRSDGIVYVLPETRPLTAVFPRYVPRRERLGAERVAITSDPRPTLSANTVGRGLPREPLPLDRGVDLTWAPPGRFGDVLHESERALLI